MWDVSKVMLRMKPPGTRGRLKRCIAVVWEDVQVIGVAEDKAKNRIRWRLVIS